MSQLLPSVELSPCRWSVVLEIRVWLEFTAGHLAQ